MKSNFRKKAAAVALAVALSAGVAGVATVDDGAANGLRKVVKVQKANGL